MKEMNEVTRRIQETLVDCPNCGYCLTQKTSSSILCKVCGIKIIVETKNERIFLWVFMLAVLAFGFGVFINSIL